MATLAELFKQALACAEIGDIEGINKLLEEMDHKAGNEFEEAIVMSKKKTCQEKLISKLIENAKKACEEGINSSSLEAFTEMENKTENIFNQAFDYVKDKYFGEDEDRRIKKNSIKDAVDACFEKIAIEKGIEVAEALIKKSVLFKEKEADMMIHKCDKAVKHAEKKS